MGKYEYKAKLIKELPDYIYPDNETVFTTDRLWYGHTLGESVGRIFEDGTRESFFLHDGDGTEWFDELREAGLLESRHRRLFNRKTYEEKSCTEYYVMWKAIDHSSDMPTVTDDCLDTCMNVKFKYTYELLLVADDLKRYVTVTRQTDGPYTYCLMDDIVNMEDTIEEWAEEGEKGFSYNSDSQLCCKMYTDFGEEFNAEFDSTRELLMSVNSIRLIKLERTIVDLRNQDRAGMTPVES